MVRVAFQRTKSVNEMVVVKNKGSKERVDELYSI